MVDSPAAEVVAAEVVAGSSGRGSRYLSLKMKAPPPLARSSGGCSTRRGGGSGGLGEFYARLPVHPFRLRSMEKFGHRIDDEFDLQSHGVAEECPAGRLPQVMS